MKLNAIKSIVIAGAIAMTAASFAQSTSVSFYPPKDRYARGEHMAAVITVRDSAGRRAPGVPIFTEQYISSIYTFVNFKLVGYSNPSGELMVPYTVPTNPNWDNIYYIGYGLFNGRYVYNSKRVPIGL
jgi:hypothetical protein